MNWYAIYTKPKCEDSTAHLLNNAGIKTLNPKIKIIKHIRRKYTDVIEPLFPSYIFAFFDVEEQFRTIKYTRGVKYIVGKNHPLIVHHDIIDAIVKRMEGDIVIPTPQNLKKGDRVLINEGPFKNFYGIFERRIPGKRRAMILLETIFCKLDIEDRSIKKA
ncbi:MAG: transcription termination/antitermination NusG family protein [Nitrospirota bacterium]